MGVSVECRVKVELVAVLKEYVKLEVGASEGAAVQNTCRKHRLLPRVHIDCLARHCNSDMLETL